MKRKISLGLALVCAAVFCAAASFTAAAAAPPGSEIAGHWLSVDYMKAIEKSHSPLEAWNDSSLVALLVDLNSDGVYQFSVTSFHEGLNYIIKSFKAKPGGAELMADSLDDDTDTPQKLSIELMDAPDGGRLAAGTLWSEEKVIYRRLPGTVASYINGLVIAGTYSDDEGKIYKFEPNGDLDWAGRKLTYEVFLDVFGSSCDNFSRSDPAKPEETAYYGFRWQNGKLALYDLVETDEMPLDCAKKPFATLTKKK